jgi:hypothetical protein
MSSALSIAPPPSPPPTPSLREIFGELHCRPDIPASLYHADRSCISASSLKRVLRSPAHYQAYLNEEASADTTTFMLGRAIHTCLLEPHLFDEEFVVAPYQDRRTKEFKAFALANATRNIITPDQAEMLTGIVHAVTAHKMAASLLRAGLVEHTIIWQDPETGLWLKIRPDCLLIDLATGLCLDIKSAEDASKRAFARACVAYDYDVQAALYTRGLRTVLGRDFDFAFLAIEKLRPYGVNLLGAPIEMLQRGERRVREGLRIIKHCQETGVWPGYQPDGDYDLLDWPNWAR